MLGIYHLSLLYEPSLEACAEAPRGADAGKILDKKKPATEGHVSGGAQTTDHDMRKDGRQVGRRQLVIDKCAVLLSKSSAVHLAGVDRHGTPSVAFRFPPPRPPCQMAPTVPAERESLFSKLPSAASSPPTPAVVSPLHPHLQKHLQKHLHLLVSEATVQ